MRRTSLMFIIQSTLMLLLLVLNVIRERGGGGYLALRWKMFKNMGRGEMKAFTTTLSHVILLSLVVCATED